MKKNYKSLFKNFVLSIKFLFCYSFTSLLFYLVVRFNWIYNNTSGILNFLAILGINIFSFYQAFKRIIPFDETNKIKSILLFSFFEIEIIMYILLKINDIYPNIIVFTIIVIFLEFWLSYLYLRKKNKL